MTTGNAGFANSQSNAPSNTPAPETLAVWETLTAFSMPSEPGSERAVMDQVAGAVAGLNLPPERLERLKTAVAEAALNAVEHGNAYNPELPVEVRVLVCAAPDGRTLAVRVTDQGQGSISTPPRPDLQAKLAGQQSPRGWGFFLIEKMVDAVHISADKAHHTIELFVYLEDDKAD
jgi:anti-sigma regulatory factor (Ser/Thr protein kinase)